MVSPLVSLMEDQVMALHTYNVEAEMLNASTDKNKLKAVRSTVNQFSFVPTLINLNIQTSVHSSRFRGSIG